MSLETTFTTGVGERTQLSQSRPSDQAIAEIARPLSLAEKIWNQSLVRKGLILVLLAAAWQLYAARLNNPLMFPTFSDTAIAFWHAFAQGGLGSRVLVSVKILLTGYIIGIFLATVLAALANGTRLGNDLLEVLTAMFNPLPAIALLPVALLWFGLGNGSITFVLIHAVLWPVALSTHSGFASISNTTRMVGRNYGLTGLPYVVKILIPAAFPSILTGLKNGWAFAWRTLIAAELVFGVSSGSGGIGWFIYENKNQLEIAYVFAGLLTVIGIGVTMDSLFRLLEQRTVNRWGMKF
ncbi:putative ABC transporter permease protein [Geobacter sp. OR-1]|uniref:ABC transporter permease n=1 Tax=Geobacter sp. OR-1 TaxID=1266765 RepID=UPI000542EB6F|nr:ABC transporter permease [Geobacter sp. OR-1]GAM10268.1 putative ABC transporter permease protein [Geobacter sp. OR-1]